MDKITRIKKSSRITEIIIGGVALIAMFVFLATSEIASRTVLNAIILCGKSLIPAIFPFLVLCGVLIRLGFPEKATKSIGKPLKLLLGVNGSCAASVIAGLLSGFPTGAAAAYGIRKRGLCSDKDCERTILISSFASPAFLIAGVGISMLGSARRGLLLWILQISATLCVGLLFNIAGIGGKKDTDYPEYYPSLQKRTGFGCIAEAIREAANTMIGICGAVIFFSVFSGYISSIRFLPNMLKCILISFFELTSGASLTSQLLLPDQSFVIIAGAAGWSGLSVHAQTALVTNGEIKLGKYIFGKCLSSVLAALFAAIAVRMGII